MSANAIADRATETENLETPAICVQRYRNTRTGKRTWVASWECQCGKKHSTRHYAKEQTAIDNAVSVLMEHDWNHCPLQGGIAFCDEPEPAE